jgi:drug/metabolite transporter (DMT)-like permease
MMVVLSALGFGMISIFVTIAIAAGAPLLSVLTWRYAVAAILLGGAAWVGGLRRPSSNAMRVIVIAGLIQAVIAGLSMSALKYIPAGTLGFLFYTYPAWVAVIARLFHSEPLTKLRLFALALSLTGIFAMVGSGGGLALHPVGVALALGSAFLYAAYLPMIARMQKGHAETEISGYVSLGAAGFLAVGAAWFGQLTLALSPRAWWCVVGLAVFSTFVAFLLFFRGLQRLGPVRTAIVSTVEPFFTSVLGALLLAQPLTRRSVLGGVLIAVAVVLLQLRPGGEDAGRAG